MQFDTIDKYVEQDEYTQYVDPIRGQQQLPWIRDGNNEHLEAHERARAMREQVLNALYPIVTAPQTKQSSLYKPSAAEVEKLPKFAARQTWPYKYESGQYLWRGASRSAMEDERGTGTLPVLVQAQRDWYYQDRDKDKGQIEREQYNHDRASRIFDKSGTPDFGKTCDIEKTLFPDS